jgi:hypothetical protein
MNALRIWNLHNHHLFAVGNYNHTCQLMSKEALKHLKVLSIEKNLADSGVIPKTFIKGRGEEILSKTRSILHPNELSFKNMRRPGDL